MSSRYSVKVGRLSSAILPDGDILAHSGIVVDDVTTNTEISYHFTGYGGSGYAAVILDRLRELARKRRTYMSVYVEDENSGQSEDDIISVDQGE